MSDTPIATLLERAMREQNAGRHSEAESICREVLSRDPENAAALHMLGIVLSQGAGRVEEAVGLVRRAIAADPAGAAMACCTLGQILAASGRAAEAIEAFEQAMRLGPESAAVADVRLELAKCLHAAGRMAEAIAVCRGVLEVRPGDAEALNLVGNLLFATGQTEQAAAVFRQAISLHPDSHFHNNLGNALHELWQLDEAEAVLRRAISLRPNFDLAHSNLGNVLKDMGRMDEAVAELRQAVTLDPQNAVSHSNLLFAMYFHPGVGPAEHWREHQIWNERHGRPLMARRNGKRSSVPLSLRVGYVSADFSSHPVGRFMLPILSHHDRERFEIVCYSDARATDEMTGELRRHANVWRETGDLSDAQLAERIRQDRIDILVDLSLHTERNRLLVFARKPAPVQATYLSYPGTSGLESIDYRLSDPYLDPQGSSEASYSEKTVRLPQNYWCYQALRFAPEVAPIPALAAGHVTFGCFNQFSKVSRPAWELWGELLRVVPDARLVVLAPEGRSRDLPRRILASRGIDVGRVQFVGRLSLRDYLDRHRLIDIGLDPFPFAGGTTSCDSLWMGVPFVTLRGATAVARGGVSILSNVGLPELIADSPDQYVKIASTLAGDLPRLAQLRSSLRARMEASPLMHAAGFVRDLENAYRRMCESDQP